MPAASQVDNRSYKWMYNTKAWQDRRAWQLRNHPLCERCKSENRIAQATVAHHIIPHKGSWELFISGKLLSSCKSCHDTIEQSIEIRGYDKTIGIDGWPTSHDHPVNVFKK